MLNQRSRFIFTALCFGFAFLYIPILLVIIYSFNDSRLVTVWGGWSFKWYVELFNNENILDAAILSFQIAAITATFATTWGPWLALSWPELSSLEAGYCSQE